MRQLSWLSECMRGKRRLFLTAMAMALLSAVLYILYPFITKMITDRVLVGTPQADGSIFHDMELLPYLLGVLLVSQLLRSGNRYGMIRILEKVSQETIERLRLSIYKNLCIQDSSFYSEYRTGDLMTRLTGDMDLVRHTIAWLSYSIVENSALFVFSMAFFFTVNAKLTFILIAIAPFLACATYFYSKSVYPLYSQLREKLSGMNSLAQENISGNKVVRAFAREDFEEQKFDKASHDFRNANLAATFQWLKFFPYVEGFSQGMNIIIVLVGGLFIIGGEMSPGDLMAFSLLSWGISAPMREMGMYLNDLQRFFASANKIMEVQDIDSRITSPKNSYRPDTPMRGEIEFRNVCCRYGCNKSKPVLDNINLTINPGETVAIMGPTGSGKTTLVNTIVRLLDVTSGEVLVDGVDVKRWQLETLRGQIGVATQDVLLYSNTVDSNIAYGDPTLPEQDSKFFAELAAAQFIEKLPQGYQTIIGERGTGLSGGQKQRIALARALAIRPAVLILDDTTSAVDTETEHFIQNSLENLPFPCTKIIIAQRITSVRQADKIIVLNEGKIIEQGTHRQLIAAGGYYSEVCRLQGVEEVSELGGQK